MVISMTGSLRRSGGSAAAGGSIVRPLTARLDEYQWKVVDFVLRRMPFRKIKLTVANSTLLKC
jgi:hypothetical protein